ncbi:DNA mismatch repair protein MutS [Verrucomicrobium sp. GAS474]|uniref:DNA mismatch repair protein MutS n=1 Tax=Verrucomicrobium sp. GAS474 TaxID=1882831 RepID=UPI00087D6F1E|nr:DNA mismatch repair protein MutS [Verrucomicrobium sp. GAS474]SDU14286.1 DNA mismatch repair protein MutS [Verrucomicrobium sp. GAS474]
MSSAETPMMQQYRALKSQIPKDALLFFRLGDFYELFFDDAKIGSEILDLTLTQRNGMPMCGLPFHAAEAYIARIIKAGRRIAICDQVEAPKPGQLVRREVTQIISPGSVLDGNVLAAKRNNYCAALVRGLGGKKHGLACLDLSTGEFQAGEAGGVDDVLDWLLRLDPSEIVIPSGQGQDDDWAELRKESNRLFVSHEGWAFEGETAKAALLEHLKTHSLDGFGLGCAPLGAAAAGGLIHYLAVELRRNLGHVRRITAFQRAEYLGLDPVTQRNLDLVETSREASGDATLLGAIDRTVTSGGGRLLRRWLLHPLRDRDALRQRLGAVGWWKEGEPAREQLRGHLRDIRDLERLIGRLSQGGGNARDLAALKLSLSKLPAVRAALAGIDLPRVAALRDEIVPQDDLVALLGDALVEEPPIPIKEGGMIRPGYRADLDELLAAGTEGKEWLARLQQREIERTGIKTLKIRFNQVFGYYLEVSHSQAANVPADYHRKQTTANAERFITPELKEMEGKILGAEERSRQLEYEIFLSLRQEAVARLDAIQQTARALSELDILAGWGALAQERDYVRPELTDEVEIEIEEGRHPVLEQRMLGERFIPNDATLNTAAQRLTILTGPNMAGKSTYIRQVALIALMAHLGTYVPAARARIGALDRIFTRVGANDDLSRGQSTFMVEMNETANILHHATDRSLVILDEIGRGTSTFDGLSIAWAVAEHLHDQARALTLFATHYHELTELALSRPSIQNACVAVREWNDEVIFLRKIIPGGADKSYGIQVARLAGLPPSVVERAKEVLRILEEEQLDESGKPRLSQPPKNGKNPSKKIVKEWSQFDLFKQEAS